MTTMLGEPFGGRSSLICGNFASRASIGTLPGYLYCVSGIGSTVRSSGASWAETACVRHAPANRNPIQFLAIDLALTASRPLRLSSPSSPCAPSPHTPPPPPPSPPPPAHPSLT